MSDSSERFIDQVLEKTEQGKLAWTTAFEDGQFKTVLPEGKLSFVVQAQDDNHRFMMLDDNLETVLETCISKAETENEPAHHPKLMQYLKIGKIQELARIQALQVNNKLQEAEKLLAKI
jgi:hypothetical protein